MARRARLDAPGTLHHVMIRGIERRNIFGDDRDREDFLTRLGKVLGNGEARCLAWVLMPNHVHLLLRTGPVPLGNLMRRLLTGYAVRFNLRHHRSGYLFQNRFRSIVCEEDPYLLELVRYIHLNGIRAGLVRDMKELDCHRWSGHSAIMGIENRPWQATEEVLLLFGKREEAARRKYRDFVSEGIGFRNGKVWSSPGATTRERNAIDERTSKDPRILGSDRFVERVLAKTQRLAQERLLLKRKKVDVDKIMGFITEYFGVAREEIIGCSRRRQVSTARSAFCHICVTQLGATAKQLSEALNLSPTAIHFALIRGGTVLTETTGLQTSLATYLK